MIRRDLPVPQGLLILGCGGHARAVADVALASGVRELLFVDPQARDGETILGFASAREWAGALPDGWQAFPAIGDNLLRKAQHDLIRARGWPMATLVAPSASLGVDCTIGEGSLVAHQAHLGPLAVIGNACIINTAAVVEHEVVVGDFAHVSIRAGVSGRCRVGSLAMIGAGATLIDGVEVVDEAIVGAGSVVLASITVAGTYVGVPVRRIR